MSLACIHMKVNGKMANLKDMVKKIFVEMFIRANLKKVKRMEKEFYSMLMGHNFKAHFNKIKL